MATKSDEDCAQCAILRLALENLCNSADDMINTLASATKLIRSLSKRGRELESENEALIEIIKSGSSSAKTPSDGVVN